MVARPGDQCLPKGAQLNRRDGETATAFYGVGAGL
jgi:hypothetical protein